MARPCTPCNARGETAMCEACRSEARAFYREAPAPSGLIRAGLIACLAIALATWLGGEIGAAAYGAAHVVIEATP